MKTKICPLCGNEIPLKENIGRYCLKDITEGTVPLHTIRADVDYAHSEANTTFGKTGHKALDLYVNGDNVGLASSCNAESSSWTYTSGSTKGTLTLNDTVAYSITGKDSDKVNIQGGIEG